jgi:hypothetical protein
MGVTVIRKHALHLHRRPSAAARCLDVAIIEPGCNA